MDLGFALTLTVAHYQCCDLKRLAMCSGRVEYTRSSRGHIAHLSEKPPITLNYLASWSQMHNMQLYKNGTQL